MKKLFLSFFIFLSILGPLSAQDTLPRFSVKNVGANRIVIGWTNNFEDIKQISIQRSFDSLKNFKSIFTVVDPTIPQNGYVDMKAQHDHQFYRLYIQLDKGVYLFSDAKRPIVDTIVQTSISTPRMQRPDSNPSLSVPLTAIDSAVVAGPVINNNRPKAEMWVPSKFVFSLKDGYIKINLPEDADKKYSIKFYTTEDELLFELKEVKERSFKLDKTNFYSAGWFKFELYENGELKEKNKFFLPKEF